MYLLFNAKIYTLDAGTPSVPAIVISGERVIAIGEAHSLKQEFPNIRQSFDLGGRAVIPGLVDAHIHLQHYALALRKVDCETATREDCLRRVADRAAVSPPGDWVLGHGWNQTRWEAGFGDAADLDRAAPLHPVYLTAKSLHAAWANSKALQLAGINRETSDPPGGKIGRDIRGNPNGILFESAMQLVADTIPAPNPQAVAEAIQHAQPQLWRMGLTGVHDFDRRDCFSALQLLHQQGNLHLRVVKSLPVEELEHAVALGLRSGFGDDYLRIGSLKAFADGALGPRTAAMLQPFESEPENRGMLLLDGEELYERGRKAVENGLSLAVHAIGDRANHEILNAFEQLRRYEIDRNLPALRHRIEHVQLIHPDDAGRLAANGILASMQPIHATSDMLMADRYWGERARLSYAWRTQLEAGARLVFGSDAPVESPDPFLGLHAAVTRRRLDGSPSPQGWYPAQRLSLYEALQAYTSGPAYAAGWESQQGKLLPGYFADLLVLNQDLFAIPVDKIPDTRPAATMVGGQWVFQE